MLVELPCDSEMRRLEGVCVANRTKDGSLWIEVRDNAATPLARMLFSDLDVVGLQATAMVAGTSPLVMDAEIVTGDDGV